MGWPAKRDQLGVVELELKHVVVSNHHRCADDGQCKISWDVSMVGYRLNRAVIDRVAQHGDLGVGVFGVGVRTGPAQIRGGCGF